MELVIRNYQYLKDYIRGRKDCIVVISYNLSKEINMFLEPSKREELEEDLRARNIRLEVF